MILASRFSRNKVLEIIKTAFLTPYPGKAEIALYALCGLLGIIATVFLFFGLYSYITLTHPPYIAAVAVAGLCLAISLIAFYIADSKSKKREKIAKAHSDLDLVNDLIDSIQSGELSELINKPVSENPKTALILASLAGFVAGEKII